MSEARAALKTASEQVAAIKREIERLESATEQAQQSTQDAMTELESYSGLDHEITDWRVAQLKKGASVKKLPDSLKAKTDARRAASEELEQAQSTEQVIADELARLRERIKPMEQERIKCAAAVLHETSDPLADELLALNARRREIMDSLEGLGEISVPMNGYMQFIRYSAKATAALNSGSADLSAWPGGITATAANEKRWRARLDALLEDAGAEITIPRPVEPRDIVLTGQPTFGMGILRSSFTLRPEEAAA